MPTTMDAVWYEQKGAARDVLRFGRLPVPSPGPGELLIRVLASAVNPSDIKARSTWSGTAMPFPRIVPHQDGAGIVEAVGKGVPPGRIGERVWFHEAQWGRPYGSAAQWIALPAARTAPLPGGASFAVGACLGVPAMTAHLAAGVHGGVKRAHVLVQGGAGAVGFYAVQWAKRLGAAFVAATVRGGARAELVRQAGADLVIDPGERPLPEAVRTHLGREDAFERVIEIDLAANVADDVRVLAPGGRLVAYSSDSGWTPALPMQAMMRKHVVLAPVLVYTMDAAAKAEAVSAIAEAVRAKALRHRIGHVLPLADTPDAHALQESGRADGKIVVAPWGVERARD